MGFMTEVSILNDRWDEIRKNPKEFVEQVYRSPSRKPNGFNRGMNGLHLLYQDSKIATMKLRWTFRCYPTPEQEEHLNRTFGCCRFVWNWALRSRSDAYRAGERISYPEISRAMTQLKTNPEYIWLNEVSSVALQQSLRDFQVAFSNFFDKRAKYPAFKKKDSRQSVNYSLCGFSFNSMDRILKIAKIGAVKVKWSRKHIPQPSSVRMIRTASGKFFVSLVVEVAPQELPKTGENIGIDFGVSRLATLSNGERVANPKHGARLQKRLAFCQRELARKTKGSKRRGLARLRVAKVHDKISNCRTDCMHKFSTEIVKRFDVICVEDLNLRGMVKNHNLARSLSDASIGTAIRMIEEKAERYGKQLVKIDRFYPSSKTCSVCGHVVEKLPLSIREWDCPECNSHLDRDENAAVNILAVGQTVFAHGGTVRLKTATAVKSKSRRSANHLSAKA
jgi:putative transposase